MIRRSLLLLLLLIFSGGILPTLNAQDPVEFGRLSSDQRQLAEQVRRLEKILLVLEQRETEDGSAQKVELLKAARLKLTDSADERPLATILEEVAADLTELRAGAALEQQAELIQFLEELLDFLLESERREQVNSLLEEAKAREEALRDLASKQSALREQTEALEKQEQADGKTDEEKRSELADAQSELNDEIRELAKEDPLASTSKETEQAAESGEQAEEELRSEEDGEESSPQDSESSEQGESSEETPPPGQKSEGEKSSGEPSSSEELQRAQEHQEDAEKMLKDAAEQAAQEVEQLKGMQELEDLINVLEKAEELAERHRRVAEEMGDLVASLEGSSRVPRSARVQLRQWSSIQKQIGVEADDLLFEIREAGADSFPFLLRGIVDDHAMLSKRLGPPRYRANSSGMILAKQLSQDWQRLIDAIRIEAERLREKAENPKQEGDGGGEPTSPPLVSFASEVQLLKMLQTDLRDRAEALRIRQEMLAKAGISLDEDDLADLENLADRQKRLRSLFESILERLKSSQSDPEDPVAGKDF